LNIDHFFYCGFTFTEDEDFLKFRIKLLNIVFLVGFTASILLSTISLLKILPFSERHEASLYFYALVIILLHLFLRANKSHYDISVQLFLAVSFLLFTEALIFVPEDSFRVIWFFILVYMAFIFSGSKAGSVYILLSIMTIVLYESFGGHQDPQIAINSATLGLILISSLFHVYTKKLSQYKERLEQERHNLEHLATTDGLTKTMNRHFFTQISNTLFSVAESKKSSLVFIMIDIDLFKNVNDTYGHHVGDNILIHIAKIVQTTIPKSMTFARIGGEEFALLSDTLTLTEAKSLAEKIRERIEKEHYQHLEHTIMTTISMGITTYREDDNSFSEIFIRADKALYLAKERGRNTVACIE